MVEPEPAEAPVIPPVIVPIVQVNVPGTEAVKLILGLVPLQIEAVAGVVTTGAGLTATVMTYGAPEQDPAVAVGVTRYSTVPDKVVLGSVSI